MANTTHSDQFDRLVLGSNTFNNAQAILRIDGKECINLERGLNDDQLLLTTDIHDSDGEHVARLRRNAWTFKGDGHDLTTSPSNLSLTENQTRHRIFAAEIRDHDTIFIEYADFYGASGRHVAVTPDAVVINGQVTIQGNTLIGTNGIDIGPTGFAM